jgi:hypothetical protein
VGTPTDLSGTGAPDSSFDVIYDFGARPNVAEAAPGDPGTTVGAGGCTRWRFNLGSHSAAHDANSSGDLDSDEEVRRRWRTPAPAVQILACEELECR